ncbi:hypothetical protein SODG_004035 [Sodalis praecaptivus]
MWGLPAPPFEWQHRLRGLKKFSLNELLYILCLIKCCFLVKSCESPIIIIIIKFIEYCSSSAIFHITEFLNYNGIYKDNF